MDKLLNLHEHFGITWQDDAIEYVASGNYSFKEVVKIKEYETYYFRIYVRPDDNDYDLQYWESNKARFVRFYQDLA